MNDENKTCYETAEQNLFTRYETHRQGTYALAYSGLLFAHLAAATNSIETLRLTYVTHTVTIKGTSLSSLLLAIQKGRAEAIRLSQCQASGSTQTPTVREINVTEGPQTP